MENGNNKCEFLFFFVLESKTSPAKSPKKIKVEAYKLSQEQKSLIKKDQPNKKLWDEAMESLSLGPVKMLVLNTHGFISAHLHRHFVRQIFKSISCTEI